MDMSWGIILIMLTQVGRSAYYEWQDSLNNMRVEKAS